MGWKQSFTRHLSCQVYCCDLAGYSSPLRFEQFYTT